MAVTDPTERMIRNLLTLQRAGNAIAAENATALLRLFERLEADLRRLDPTGVAKQYRALRRDKFFRLAQRRIAEWTPEMDKVLRDALVTLGRHQAEFARDTLVVTLGQSAKTAVQNTPITQQRLRAILKAEPFEGRVLRDHARRISANMLDRVKVQVRVGMVNEEPIAKLVTRVRGTGVGKGGVLGRTRKEAEALVRTAVNFVSNVGMQETFKENSDVLAGVQFSAAMDDRTTEECAALDGTVWAADDPDIATPPLHWNCRSILVPVIDWKGLGLTPPPEGTRAARDLRGVAAADLDRNVSARRRTGDLGKAVQVPGDMTYGTWLKGQSSAVQARVLGKGKAELFRSGQITLKDLIRRDGTVRPLSEVLKRLDE